MAADFASNAYSPRDRLPEDRNWVTSNGFDRRSMIAGTAYAAGFALACQPVAAATIETPGDGITQLYGHFPAPDGFSVPAFLAKPAGGKPAPVIVVVHEVFGVHEWIKDICRRFAKAGYCAVAPDLYARVGDATKIADIKILLETIVAKTPDAQVLADIDHAYGWAAKQGGDAAKRGITGFCWGGRIVWLYAAHAKSLHAGVAFYGKLQGPGSPLQPRQVMDAVADLHAPVLGQYGGKDKGIPEADVIAMRARLGELKKSPPSDIILYPDADHGFMADYRPSYNPEAAAKAWTAALGWFGKYLKG